MSKIGGSKVSSAHSTHGSMTLTISIISRLPWQRFLKWYIYKLYLEIYMIYVENVFDFMII